jgi:hypothetical protein
MLAAEPGVTVDAVDIGVTEAVDAAIAREPHVIVVEEGGAVDAADVVRRSRCPVVLDVDITSSCAWTLRRESLSIRPDDFLGTIRDLVAHSGQEDTCGEADRSLQPAQITG